MRNRLSNIRRLAIGGGLSLLLLASGAAYSQVFIGLDLDNDLDCENDLGIGEDMNVVGMAAGDSIEIDIFYDNTGQGGGGLLSFNCTVCVQDKDAVSLQNATYDAGIPGAWTLTPVQNTIDHPTAVSVDQWIIDSYPEYMCWLFQATDFTFSAPIADGLVPYGTIAFRAARPGNLGLHIDGDPLHSGWFANDFSSGGCTAGLPQDGNCQCVNMNDGSISVEKTASWGDVKSLFR